MHVLPPYRRLLLLTEANLGLTTSKTAAVLLRYRPDDVVAVIDSLAAGQTLTETIPWAPAVPILADVRHAAALRPDALCIGIAPVGGELPDPLRAHIGAALRLGIDVVSGLHTALSDDAEFSAAAAGSGARILDVRRPSGQRIIAGARARHTRCRRVLTVGSDGNVGKMVAALELTVAARRRGLDARFVATGQSGIMVAGRGVAIDACVADFAPGATEQLVLDAAECDICFVEGQGSIAHPGFSAVTLALVHGACPDAMVLVHHLGRTHYRAPPHDALPALEALVRAYEQAAALLHPARVVAVALNTVERDHAGARAAAQQLESELGLPVADPVRNGSERLLDAVLRECRL